MLNHHSDPDGVISAVARAIASSQLSSSSSVDHLQDNSDSGDITALNDFTRTLFCVLSRFLKRHRIASSQDKTYLEAHQPLPVIAPVPSPPPLSPSNSGFKSKSKLLRVTLRRRNWYDRARFSDVSTVMELRFCHIFSESINAALKDAAKMEESLQGHSGSFGYVGIVQDLATAEKVHLLEKVMIMDARHSKFVHANSLGHLNLTHEVESMSVDPLLPLPDTDYLRIHAAARLSGASGLFDDAQEDMYENPDTARSMPAFATSLHARLEHVSIVEAC
ncbi:hypothetical protein C8Q74DRAFT_1221399 [Fomes fomentarius]|nr:hypothetical protein C8Q74DRAFT_1221399 [Fomes fomentarius]